MDILTLIKDVAFPIFAAAYLLVEQSRKLEKMSMAITKMNVYLMVLLAEQKINVGDSAMVALIENYLQSKKDGAK